MKGQPKIVFHNPNTQEETAKYLCNILVDMLIEIVEENPEKVFEKLSSLIDGGEIENSSIL